MKNKLILILSVAVTSLFISFQLSTSNKDYSIKFANIEALAENNEGAGSNCPNGGYWSSGLRSESIDDMWEKWDISAQVSLGYFDRKGTASVGISWNEVKTVAYNCDHTDNKLCLVCNRYKL